MYTLKMSYGDVDEPETETVEILGTYEDEGEALKAAEDKFAEVMESIYDPCEVWFGEVKTSPYRYYVNYGAIDEYNTRISDKYYEVSVKEES